MDNAFISEVSYQEGGTCATRVQPNWQMVVIYTGWADIHIDSKIHRLNQSEMCLLHPGHLEFFQFATDQTTHHSWLQFSPAGVTREQRLALKQLPFKLALTKNITSIMEMGIAMRLQNRPVDQPVLNALGQAALQEYIAASQRSVQQVAMPDTIIKVQRFVDRHFQDKVTLHDMADAGAVSPNYLIRLFKTHLGLTPVKYLWSIRVRRGIDLIKNTGLTFSEIAYQTGFETPYHFSRLVKEKTGKSPRTMRSAMHELSEGEYI